MSVRVAINGFGRIGRNILRAVIEADRDDIEVVAINDLAPVETNAHLLRFDSVHGRFPGEVTVKGDTISCGNGAIKVTAVKDPDAIAVEGTRHRRRAGMHRHFHVEGKGFRPSAQPAPSACWSRRRPTASTSPWFTASIMTSSPRRTPSSPTPRARPIASRLSSRCSTTRSASTRVS